MWFLKTVLFIKFFPQNEQTLDILFSCSNATWFFMDFSSRNLDWHTEQLYNLTFSWVDAMCSIIFDLDKIKVVYQRVLTRFSHFFTRSNLKKMGPLLFCLLPLLGIHRHPMQKEFLKSCEGFLRAALTVHGHPGSVWNIAKMAIFDPCMEFVIFWAKWLHLRCY